MEFGELFLLIICVWIILLYHLLKINSLFLPKYYLLEAVSNLDAFLEDDRIYKIKMLDRALSDMRRIIADWVYTLHINDFIDILKNSLEYSLGSTIVARDHLKHFEQCLCLHSLMQLCSVKNSSDYT